MSILRSLALLTLGLFFFSVTVVFSTPSYHSNFAVYAEALGTGISAWARARADEAQDAGWYSVWAQVGNDKDRDSGNYQGIVEFSADASESFYFWESPPTVFHSAFMN